MDTVAKEALFGGFPGSEKFEVRVEIGTPNRCQVAENEWTRSVTVDPLHPKLGDIHGGSSLQALCLALSRAKSFLNDFLEKGDDLTYGDFGRFDVNAVSNCIASTG